MSNIPNVNNFRMGVRQNFQGYTDSIIDTPGERRTSRKFHGVKNQEENLASDLASMDNTYLDSDPRRGSVVRYRDGYEAGTGNYIEDRTHYTYNRRTGAPVSLTSNGSYTTPSGVISASKDVSWDQDGQAQIRERRRYRDHSGWTTGRESVTASQSHEGLQYKQSRSGFLFSTGE